MNLEYLVKVIIPALLIAIYSWFMMLMIFDFIIKFVDFDKYKDSKSTKRTELLEEEHDGE